jgi:protein tyrosine/serine phosphatase
MSRTVSTGLLDRFYNFWVDQGFLRVFWANAAEIAPQVYRANQPDAARLAKLKAKGLRAVLYLRGSHNSVPFRAEERICADMGLDLHVLNLSSHRLPDPQRVLDLIDLFRRIDRPFLIHCRAGADRTGLASAIYLLAIEGRSVAEARSMLSARFGHWSLSSTGILDQMVHAYAAARSETGITFEDWVRKDYDPAGLTARFESMGLWARVKQMRG